MAQGQGAWGGGTGLIEGIAILLIVIIAVPVVGLRFIRALLDAPASEKARKAKIASLSKVGDHVAEALIAFQQGTGQVLNCPVCHSEISVFPTPGPSEEVMTDCSCHLARGVYSVARRSEA